MVKRLGLDYRCGHPLPQILAELRQPFSLHVNLQVLGQKKHHERDAVVHDRALLPREVQLRELASGCSDSREHVGLHGDAELRQHLSEEVLPKSRHLRLLHDLDVQCLGHLHLRSVRLPGQRP